MSLLGKPSNAVDDPTPLERLSSLADGFLRSVLFDSHVSCFLDILPALRREVLRLLIP
ncbi:hypothetical protein [Halostagnicola kamekurae]|uniref:hypothetical protein n=1 Tax=Halostagnicola kamekurae TaxID=619731 RepID=UPI001FE3B1E9|nr:hypothetical protein [Halostagnicola kamekurae]